jgi:hypothetical protein
MKKLLILASFLAFAPEVANAQLTLTEASPYTQNFDNIGSGMPAGWECYKAATFVSLGTPDVFNSAPSHGVFFDTINCPGEVFKHGAKNCASAAIVSPSATCAQQQTITNRALGIRQGGTTHPGYDPGSAFVLHLANTSGKSGFTLSFKLQSLDTRSTKRTTWIVDYGFGSIPPLFIKAPATGYLVTGGKIFSDTVVTVNFGAALDNQNQDVWMRIVTLNRSSGGAGYRTTTAIDDFILSYSNTNSIPGFSSISPIGFSVLGDPKADQITFACSVEQGGNYNIDIYDIKGDLVYKKQLDLNPNPQDKIIINDLNLHTGMYIAKLSNSTIQRAVKVIIP